MRREDGAVHWHSEEFGPENEAEVPGLNLAINHEHTDEIEYKFKSDSDLEIIMENDDETNEAQIEETKGQKEDAKREFYDSNSIADVDPDIEYRDEMKRKEELESWVIDLLNVRAFTFNIKGYMNYGKIQEYDTNCLLWVILGILKVILTMLFTTELLYEFNFPEIFIPIFGGNWE